MVNWSGNAFASNPTGFTISANGLEMVLSGNLAFTAYDASGWKISDFNLGMISGNLTSSYVYDTTTTGEPLVAYADNLNIDWTDLSSFMVAQPDMGPPPVTLGSSTNPKVYEALDPGHNTTGAITNREPGSSSSPNKRTILSCAASVTTPSATPSAAPAPSATPLPSAAPPAATPRGSYRRPQAHGQAVSPRTQLRRPSATAGERGLVASRESPTSPTISSTAA